MWVTVWLCMVVCKAYDASIHYFMIMMEFVDNFNTGTIVPYIYCNNLFKIFQSSSLDLLALVIMNVMASCISYLSLKQTHNIFTIISDLTQNGRRNVLKNLLIKGKWLDCFVCLPLISCIKSVVSHNPINFCCKNSHQFITVVS